MLDIINKLRRIIPQRYKLFAVFLGCLMGISALFELCMIGLLMPLALTVSNLDLLQENGFIGKLYRFCGSPETAKFITLLALLLLLFAISKTLFNYLMIWCQSFFIARLTRVLTENLVANYVAAPYLFHVRTGMSELINRVRSIRILLSQVFQSLLLICSELFVVAALTVGICIVMPLAAVLLVLLGGLTLLAYFPMKRYMTRLGKDQFEWEGLYSKALLQAFATIKEVKLSCDESCFINSIVNARWHLSNTEKKAYDVSQMPRLSIELLAVAVAMGILIFLIHAQTSLSHIIMYAAVFIAAMFRMLPSFSRIQYNLVIVRGGSFILDQLYADLVDFEREPLYREEEPIHFEHLLEVKNLCFSYGEKEVFRNFSMKIRRNESVAFVGPSGSGKTTLADLIIGFLVPQSGSITADGGDIFRHLRSWRRKIGYVSQNIYLLDDTIRGNIAFCQEQDIDDAKVIQAMKMAQIYDYVQTLPDKENTVIGEMGIRLSGGQRQRIAIARALYQEPELLILDEATSALDNETEKAFIDALHSLKGTLTIIMIAHRLSSIQHCDRIISLEQKTPAAGQTQLA